MPYKRWKPSEAISDYDIKEFQRLVKAGREEEAVERMARRYPKEIAVNYARWALAMLKESAQRIFSAGEMAQAERQLSIATVSTSRILTESMGAFIGKVLAPKIFTDNKITVDRVRKAILQQTQYQFETLIDGAMAGTRSDILAMVRKFQREMIVRNQALRFQGAPEEVIEWEKAHFREMLENKFPLDMKHIEEGKILKSRMLSDGTFRHFDLEEYTEMSVHRTLMNLEQTSVETAAQIGDFKVIELYLRDHRKIKSDERPVCAEVLAKKVHGRSLLALDPETAKALGILTLDAARNQGCMGFNCRHSIRNVDAAYRNQLKKALFVKGLDSGKSDDEEGAA